jgi:CubicO group peptidase (beta-lactamase class C family)
MLRRKTIIRAIGIILLGAFLFILKFSWDIGRIASGMVSHTLCTNVLMLGRNQAEVETTDLSSVQRKNSTSEINREGQTVTSTFGFGPFGNSSTSVYRPGCGCGVVGDFSIEEIKQQSNLKYKELSENTQQTWQTVNDTIGGVNYLALNKIVNGAFEETAKTIEDTKNTRAVLVHYKGNLIAEKYGEGFHGDLPLRGMSMTKSIISALAGILVHQDKLDINQTTGLPAYENATDARKNITIDQILKMTAGYDYDEAYESDPRNLLSTMLMTQGDMADFADDVPLRATPGETWDYQTVHSVLLSKVVRNHAGSFNDYMKLVHEDFFNKVGMHHSFLQADASGTFIGGAFAYASPRDWMRFGLLYLNDGIAENGERILANDWVKYTNTPSNASLNSRAYGAQFWLNAKSKNQWIPNLPEDMFAAKGHYGQYVIIIPSMDLVIVRLGQTYNKKAFDIDKFIVEVLATLVE